MEQLSLKILDYQLSIYQLVIQSEGDLICPCSLVTALVSSILSLGLPCERIDFEPGSVRTITFPFSESFRREFAHTKRKVCSL